MTKTAPTRKDMLRAATSATKRLGNQAKAMRDALEHTTPQERAEAVDLLWTAATVVAELSEEKEGDHR